jgi:RNA polymerase sigma-70 factor, ECF subfamily
MSNRQQDERGSDCREAILMRGIQARDREALETLYLAYHARLCRFLGGFVPCNENVDEVIIATFVSVWTRPQDFPRGSRVLPWIIGIAYRNAMRLLRRLKLSSPLAPAGLDTSLARLPLDERITLALVYQLHLSLEEIAQVTRAPLQAVKARMLRVRLQLGEYALQQSGEGRAEHYSSTTAWPLR